MKKQPTLLVTGSNSGIGKAVTLELLEADYQVVGISRHIDPFEHPRYQSICLDLSQLENLADEFHQIIDQHPGIDGIVFCAGFGRFGSLEEFSFDQIQTLLNLNLTSQIILTRAFLPLLKKQEKGDLIYIGSEAALSGGKRGAVYSASKFGLRGFTQALRQECASNGIRVTLINPGMVRTGFFDKLDFKPGQDPSHAIEAKDIAKIILHVLTMRPGTVIDEINLSPQKKVIDFGKN